MTDLSSTTSISGFVAEGYEPVRDAFAANFAEHGDIGAGTALYVGGECVVDLTGGVADEATGAAYDADTLQLVFSTTKGAAAVCANLLAQRGLLDFDEKVSTYWPEFAAEGKGDVTVAQLISHQAALSTVDAELTRDEVLAIDPIVEALAAQKPLWELGTGHGYHALTYGWLVAEVVRRIDGRRLGQFFAEEVAGPLGLDFWIGLPADLEARVSDLIVAAPEAGAMPDIPSEIAHLVGKLVAAYMDPNSLTNRALGLNGVLGVVPGEPLPWNLPEVHASEIPAANGITNARPLAKMYAACVSEVDGVRLLDDVTIKAATQTQSEGEDNTLIVPTRFGYGFFLSSGFSPLLGEGSFGHAGAGGSLGLAEPTHGIGFGYVMNKMATNLSNDPRTVGLLDAVRSCVGLD